MKTITKIIIVATILLFIMSAVSAALETGLQAPDEFEKSDIWDTAIYDIYSLKTDKNVLLYIMNYTDEDYDLFFKTNTDDDYYANPLDNNMVMGKDNYFNDGYVSEVIEHDGNKYIVQTCLNDTPTNDQIKDSSKYLTEFNKINNVKPITV